jgi:hypothetical protein
VRLFPARPGPRSCGLVEFCASYDLSLVVLDPVFERAVGAPRVGGLMSDAMRSDRGAREPRDPPGSVGCWFFEVCFEHCGPEEMGNTLADGPRLGVLAGLGIHERLDVADPSSLAANVGRRDPMRVWWNTGRKEIPDSTFTSGDRCGLFYDYRQRLVGWFKNGRCLGRWKVPILDGGEAMPIVILTRNVRNRVRVSPRGAVWCMQQPPVSPRSSYQTQQVLSSGTVVADPEPAEEQEAAAVGASDEGDGEPHTDQERALVDMGFDMVLDELPLLLTKFDNNVEQVVYHLLGT